MCTHFSLYLYPCYRMCLPCLKNYTVNHISYNCHCRKLKYKVNSNKKEPWQTTLEEGKSWLSLNFFSQDSFPFLLSGRNLRVLKLDKEVLGNNTSCIKLSLINSPENLFGLSGTFGINPFVVIQEQIFSWNAAGMQ